MKPRLILFDLDGTLLDSQRGIEHTLRLTLAAHNVDVPLETSMRWCIGSSLWSIFEHYLQTSDPHVINGAVAMYRHIYRDGPMFEFSIYPGVQESLAMLHGQGVRMVLATAKVHEQAREIVNATPLSAYLAHVYGSEIDGTNVHKRDLIRHILQQEQVAADQAIMVGDRHHDIDGAAANGISSIAAAYGYGDVAEYERASAIIHNAMQLPDVVFALPTTSR